MNEQAEVIEGAIDIQEIMQSIPHRYPFLLVDRVLNYIPGKKLVAIKNVSINEQFFSGHFPQQAVMPGVLIVEALAQAAGILHNKSHAPAPGHEFMYFFAGLDNVKFKHMVTPGDQLRLEIEFLAQKRSFWKVGAQAFVEDKLACSAQLMTAVKEVKSDR